MARIDKYDFPVANDINPITKRPIYGDPTSIVGAVAGPLVGGMMAPDTPTPQQAPGFTPYGITSGFATSTIDPTTHTASYTLDPRLAAYRDSFYQGATNAMPNANQTAFANQMGQYGQGMFNKYANLDTNKMTQDYFNQQQANLLPSRLQEGNAMNNRQFGTGTLGLGIGTPASQGSGYLNPMEFARQTAYANADANMLNNAQDRAMGIQSTGLNNAGNMLNQANAYAMQPYQNANSLFGFGSGVENLGVGNIVTGANIGAQSSAANANAATINNAYAQQGYNNGMNQASMWGNAVRQGVGAIGNSVKNSGGWANNLPIWLGGTGDIPQSQSFDYYYNMGG